MKKYLSVILSIISLTLLVSCSDDEPTVDNGDPQAVEVTYITYDEAVEQGLPCLGAENFFDEIYPERYIDLVLPKDGSEVTLKLETMARVNGLSYRPCENGYSSNVPKECSAGYYLRCSTERCFVFVPYTIKTPYTLEISQEDPTTIKFKAASDYKYRDGILVARIARYYGNGVTIYRDDPDEVPVLFVTLRFEK